jgi:hypothetical protein
VLGADQPINDRRDSDSIHMLLNHGMLMRRVALAKIGSVLTLQPTVSTTWQRTYTAMGYGGHMTPVHVCDLLLACVACSRWSDGHVVIHTFWGGKT